MTDEREDGYVLLVGDENTYLRRRGERVELAEGVLDADDLDVGYGETVETHIGERFAVVEPDPDDLRRRAFDQTTQTVSHKDAGYIIARTGVGEGSTVAEAGSGSGFLAYALSRAVDHVYSYDDREDHAETARENLRRAAVGNVTVRVRDVKQEGFGASGDGAGHDLVFLDMMHPEKAVPEASRAVRVGGYVVCYCPVFEQVRDCVDALEGTELAHTETVELSRREWRVFPARPEPQTVPHTAFLTLTRRTRL